MKTIETVREQGLSKDSSIGDGSSTRKHFGAGRRRPTWRVLGSGVAGFPAFLWQLTRSHQN